MALTLTVTDLYTDISKDELDGMTAELIETGQSDPVDTAIADGLAIVSMFCNPFAVDETTIKRLWRLLAISYIYNRLGRINEKRKEERDWCMSMLKDIRDGKFKHLALDTTLPVVTTVAYSSSAGVDFTGQGLDL